MKKLILLCFLTSLSVSGFTQDNPYKIFGYKPKVEYKDNPLDIYRVNNSDKNSPIRFLTIDRSNKIIRLLNDRDSVLRTVIYTDEDLLRWVTVDPKAEKYPSFSPYNYTLNNPIKNVDPDGKAVQSPIYDRLTGEYLGNDSQGFKGDILFANKMTYAAMASNGPIDHAVAEKSFLKINNDNVSNSVTFDKLTLGGSQGDGISLKAVSGAYTDILSKSGFNTDALYNGAVSVSYDKNGLKAGFNSPVSDYFSHANTEVNFNGSGKMNITAQFTDQSGGTGSQSLTYFTTVANVQEGLGNHEYNFHGVQGLTNKDHPNIFKQEATKSPFFKNTTDQFKQYINGYLQQ